MTYIYNMLISMRLRNVPDRPDCFECGKPAEFDHHVVPAIYGGTKTVPLCAVCHSKVHGLSLLNHRTLTKAGMVRAKARGVDFARYKFDADKRALAVDLYRQRTHTVMEVCRTLGITKPTLYGYIREAEGGRAGRPATPENDSDKLVHGTLSLTKLTAQEVLEIRSKYRDGSAKRSLAREYGVCPSTIRAIIFRWAWAHI